ncbi:FliH/SctL family protein [Emcibacter sp.]|uniref:FliH/SctL family protein n=1 Tax=Emcibacter sp. TaxID=1979954 RepID=UPI002AA76197|nr:FliH/SctL family protein [Emcibacter sp.]
MTAVKFTFDNNFEDEYGPRSKAKIEELENAAYQRGLAEGKQEILDGIEQHTQFLLQNILAAIQILDGRHEEQLAMMHKEAAILAHSIVSKLAPALVANTPLQEIEALVSQCLKNSPLEPRIVVRVDENILPRLEKEIDRLKESSGYAGQIVLLAEPMRHISDCRVEWADGGADRDFDALKATIDRTVQLFIEAPAPGHLSGDDMTVEVAGLPEE